MAGSTASSETSKRTETYLERLNQQSIEVLGGPLDLYAEALLKIKPKVGPIVPFKFKPFQIYLEQKLEEQRERTGMVRALLLKGRKMGCCLDPDTKILTADLRWTRIADASVGMELVALEEDPPPVRRHHGRQMQTATVQAVVPTRQMCWRITLDDGRELISSAKHRWLIRKSQTQWKWRAIDDGRRSIKVGDQMRSVTTPWGEPNLDDAWFGGMIDGEGSFEYDSKRTGVRLRICQRAGAVLERMKSYCTNRGYGHCSTHNNLKNTKAGYQPIYTIDLSKIGEVFRVLGLTRPTRFIGLRWWEGKSMPDNGQRTIVKIEPLGERAVIDIQTSTGTFLAEGIVSHNSTYVGGRFFRRAHAIPETAVYIFSHERPSALTLFNIADLFWQRLPPEYRPYRGEATKQSMRFNLLGSSYGVGTAGAQATGRAQTHQLFHGSEVAFWPKAEDHISGALQTVADMPGTEIILESTANGIGGTFYEMWEKAERGEGDYMAIFLPWFWDDDYRRAAPEKWRPEGEESEYRDLYDLDVDQIYWFHLKNIELGGRPGLIHWKTRQEYPGNAQEAFQSGGIESFIRSEIVMKARKFTAPEPADWIPLVMGVDVARGGSDRTRMLSRRGRILGREVNKTLDTDNEMVIVHHIATEIEEHGIDMTFVDVTGMGGGIVSRLRELHFGDRVTGIQFGAQCPQPEKYPNMRNYMWGELKEWLTDQLQADIPDDNTLHRHFCAPTYDYDSNSRLKLESKKLIRKRLKLSPDGGDAAGLTFAAKVHRRVRKSSIIIPASPDATSWMRH